MSTLEFPAVMYGPSLPMLRKAEAEGRWCAREYLKHGTFPPPRKMRPVLPGEGVVMHSACDFGKDRPGWRLYLFNYYVGGVTDDMRCPEAERRRAAFESFCRETPWGALYHAVSPFPPQSVGHMAPRLASLLRFWDVLQGPRYWYRDYPQTQTFEELIEDIYRETLEAWCPGGPASLREHLALTVERMARATREDCFEAVLRLIPVMLKRYAGTKHPDVLNDVGFLREQLAALSSEDFDSLSSAYTYAVNNQLHAWDRALGRH